MQSIESQIMSKIREAGEGKIYFPSDFSEFGESKSVLKALERLVKSQSLIRLGRGIYYYPKIDKELGLGILYPSLDTIAESIAKRDKIRIVPTGHVALNRLGLSTQVPMNIVYLTDGSPRRIKIGGGKGIQFKRIAPKFLAFRNGLVMLIVFALKELGENNVTPEVRQRIRELLQKESKSNVMQDSSLMPGWIKSIIINSYE